MGFPLAKVNEELEGSGSVTEVHCQTLSRHMESESKQVLRCVGCLGMGMPAVASFCGKGMGATVLPFLGKAAEFRRGAFPVYFVFWKFKWLLVIQMCDWPSMVALGFACTWGLEGFWWEWLMEMKVLIWKKDNSNPFLQWGMMVWLLQENKGRKMIWNHHVQGIWSLVYFTFSAVVFHRCKCERGGYYRN